MDCETVREDIEAYSLGALDAAASRRLQAHVRACGGCRDLVNAYARTVDELPLTVAVVKAPPRLKERVLGGVGVFRPNVTPATLVRTSRWWAAAAAVFLAFGIGAVVWGLILSAQVNDLKRDNAALAKLSQSDAEDRTKLLQLQADVNTAKSQQHAMESVISDQAALIRLALDPDLIPTELSATNGVPQTQCRYVWSTTQVAGALNCQNMPAISFALTYQLWAIRGDKTISMGTFSPRPDGTASLLYKPTGEGGGSGPIANLFITLESASSVARQPSAEVILEKTSVQQALR